MKTLFEVHPKRPISGILPNCKRVSEVQILELSRAEFLRCVQNGTVYAVIDGQKILITDSDWEKALALFEPKSFEITQPVEEKEIAASEGSVISGHDVLNVNIVNAPDENSESKDETADSELEKTDEESEEPVATENEEIVEETTDIDTDKLVQESIESIVGQDEISEDEEAILKPETQDEVKTDDEKQEEAPKTETSQKTDVVKSFGNKANNNYHGKNGKKR